MNPCFLDLGTSLRCVIGFTLWPLNPRGECTRFSLDRRLGEPQRRSGRRGEQKSFDSSGTRTQTPRTSSSYPAAIPTALSRLVLQVIYRTKLNSIEKLAVDLPHRISFTLLQISGDKMCIHTTMSIRPLC
jgi:hypothetical protein